MQPHPDDLEQFMRDDPIKGAVVAGGSARTNAPAPWRLALWRQWHSDKPRLAVVMLNPSTADAREDDHTIGRLVSLSMSHGYGSFVVTNLFALRATDPHQLLERGFRASVGPGNDDWIRAACAGRDVLVAWGAGTYGGRVDEVWQIINPIAARVLSFGRNRDGSPPHPARLSNNVKMELWSPAKEAATNV